jgi:hypothetical protein
LNQKFARSGCLQPGYGFGSKLLAQKNLPLNCHVLNIGIAAFPIYGRHCRGQQCCAALINGRLTVDISQADSGAR